MVNSKQRGVLFGKTFMQALLCNYSESSIRSSFNASAKRNQAPTSPPPPPRLLALNFGLSRKLGTMTHRCSDGPLGQAGSPRCRRHAGRRRIVADLRLRLLCYRVLHSVSECYSVADPRLRLLILRLRRCNVIARETHSRLLALCSS